MKKILFTIIMVSYSVISCYALPINEKYSYKDFTNQDLSFEPAEDFNNTRIVGSCFYQENKKNAKIFPKKMKGVEFDRCNLDNVKVNGTNKVLDTCTNKKIKVRDDKFDLEYSDDDYNNPVKKVSDI